MFQFKFDQAGKGINPDAPRKEGFAWFLDILYREFFPMLGLNLIFLLYCLPIVTIGPAFVALNSLLMRMVRDKPVDVFRDFFPAFKENFKSGMVIFWVQVAVVWMFVINYRFYAVVNPSIQGALLLFGLILWMANLYLVPILVSVDLPFKHLVKNSIFLAFLNLKFSLPLLLVTVVSQMMNVFNFPYSLFPTLIFGNVFLTFIVCFYTYYGIEKYCYGTHEAEIQEEIQEKIDKKKKPTGQEELDALDAEIEALKKQAEEEEEES